MVILHFHFFSVHMWLQFVLYSLSSGPRWGSYSPLWGWWGNIMSAVGCLPCQEPWAHNLCGNCISGKKKKSSLPNLTCFMPESSWGVHSWMDYPYSFGQEDLEEWKWICFSHRPEARRQPVGIIENFSYFFSCFSRGILYSGFIN